MEVILDFVDLSCTARLHSGLESAHGWSSVIGVPVEYQLIYVIKSKVGIVELPLSW